MYSPQAETVSTFLRGELLKKKKQLKESYAAETSVAAEPKIFTLVFYRKSLPLLVLETSVFLSPSYGVRSLGQIPQGFLM